MTKANPTYLKIEVTEEITIEACNEGWIEYCFKNNPGCKRNVDIVFGETQTNKKEKA